MARKRPLILPKRPVLVEWRKLKTAWGYADHDKWRVEFDPRMDDLTMLQIAPHEYSHIYFPGAGEKTVTDFGNDLGHFLFGLGFRRIDKDGE